MALPWVDGCLLQLPSKPRKGHFSTYKLCARSAASSTSAGAETIPDVTYSYQNPFPSSDAVRWASGYKFNNKLSSDFALAADVNPGTQTIDGVIGSPATVKPNDPLVASSRERASQTFGNSINHKNQGQNVLYGDGHVEFQTTCWCGSCRGNASAAVRDNIYTNGTQSTAGGGFGVSALPRDPFDSVLLPTSN